MSQLRLDTSVYEHHFQSMLDEIRASKRGFEFKDVAMKYTLAISRALIIGDGKGDEERMRQFSDDFSYLTEISSALTVFNNQVPFLAQLLFGKRFSHTRKRANDFVDAQVRKALEMKADQKVKGEWKSVLEGLVGQGVDVQRITKECLNLLLAGHGTVGITFSELFYYLARYPDVWQKLRKEVAVFEGRVPTLAEMKGLVVGVFEVGH